jgi:hypothetical protein
MPKADASASKAARDKRYDKRTKTADFLHLKQENDRLTQANHRLRHKLYDLLQDDPRRQRTFECFEFCGSPATYPNCNGHDWREAGPDCDGYG